MGIADLRIREGDASRGIRSAYLIRIGGSDFGILRDTTCGIDLRRRDVGAVPGASERDGARGAVVGPGI